MPGAEIQLQWVMTESNEWVTPSTSYKPCPVFYSVGNVLMYIISQISKHVKYLLNADPLFWGQGASCAVFAVVTINAIDLLL